MTQDPSPVTHDLSPITQVWDEASSAVFIDRGRVYTPRREEIAGVFCDLIPAGEEDAFCGAELGTGTGWLSEAILSRYPRARMIGLDGSEAMRAETAKTLARFGDRAEVRPFRLEERAWLETLPDGLRCVVSSLVIHHLDGDGKRRLFAEIAAKLEPGGALLVCDVVLPANDWGRRQMARGWDAETERQSLEMTGNAAAFERFTAEQWNFYRFPDPDDEVDKPSTTLDQLRWLAEAGFVDIDVFWARAGHVLFGGYRPVG